MQAVYTKVEGIFGIDVTPILTSCLVSVKQAISISTCVLRTGTRPSEWIESKLIVKIVG